MGGGDRDMNTDVGEIHVFIHQTTNSRVVNRLGVDFGSPTHGSKSSGQAYEVVNFWEKAF